MKIGLLRHFKVNQPFPSKKLFSKSEVINWFAAYNNSHDIEYKHVDLLNINWQHCYSSPMGRAIRTAKFIYEGEISEAAELKELDILHQLPPRLSLPFIVWAIIVRIMSLTPTDDTKNFKSRIVAFLDSILKKNEDVIIVSHWFVMRVVQKELLKRGIVGERIKSHDYATLYLYEPRQANER